MLNEKFQREGYGLEKFKNGDRVTILFSILFAASIILYYSFINMYTLGLLAGMGGALAYRTIKTMNNIGDLNYLPFVPALAVGALAGFFL